MAYTVLLTRSARKELQALPEQARNRVFTDVAALEEDPRPCGCVKYRGQDEDAYRIVVGEYRVLYLVDDDTREVRVFRIRHRSKAYRPF